MLLTTEYIPSRRRGADIARNKRARQTSGLTRTPASRGVQAQERELGVGIVADSGIHRGIGPAPDVVIAWVFVVRRIPMLRMFQPLGVGGDPGAASLKVDCGEEHGLERNRVGAVELLRAEALRNVRAFLIAGESGCSPAVSRASAAKLVLPVF